MSKGNILVIDDELSMRQYLSILLKKEGYTVQTAKNGAEAIDLVSKNRYAVILTDYNMPEAIDGIHLLAKLRQIAPQSKLIVITAFASTEIAMKALEIGAVDYISKPFTMAEIRNIVEKANDSSTATQAPLSTPTAKPATQKKSLLSVISESKSMKEVLAIADKIATSDSTVLISGESGVGKEVVARYIHEKSNRSSNDWFPVNCGAIPITLLESELFGHEKGSFTGANSLKKGYFEVASNGTLFLDEIGELPEQMQVKLLRVLQEKTFVRVGGTTQLKTNVRLVAATNKNLREEMKQGRFREDLYYRLNVFEIYIPSLRERQKDIPRLLHLFLKQLNAQYDKSKTIGEDAIETLGNYHFPGNIRELKNILERAFVLSKDDNITADALSFQDVDTSSSPVDIHLPANLDEVLAELEKQYLTYALLKSNNQRRKAAELLGISERSLRYRITKAGLSESED
ncbi:sigma-54-dependent Fis family transcriptional regulator [bacterium]|nr:sigma-54-dependent Fis family transcriptional regulator [bacterium]